ncbi:hypothetical protein [Streptomyces sp. NPDC055005]
MTTARHLDLIDRLRAPAFAAGPGRHLVGLVGLDGSAGFRQWRVAGQLLQRAPGPAGMRAAMA